MSNFDKDKEKIKDMEYDLKRERQIGKDGSEFRVTPYKNGTGYKYDYYDKNTYGNTKHNSTHVESDLDENWSRTDNNRDNGTKNKSSGSGCYLTTACMSHMQENFDDSCNELITLRWFRDNFVSKEDIKHYYDIAPIIVDRINSVPDNNRIYAWIYEHVVQPCVIAIQQQNYEFAYNRYKESILVLEEQFAKSLPEQESVKTLKKAKP